MTSRNLKDNKATRAFYYLQDQFNSTRLEFVSNTSNYYACLKTLLNQLANVGNQMSETNMTLQLVVGLAKGNYDTIATIIQKCEPLPDFNKP